MIETGIYKHNKEVAITVDWNKCFHGESKFRPMGLNHVSLAFVVLMGGSGIASVAFIMEVLYMVCKRKMNNIDMA